MGHTFFHNPLEMKLRGSVEPHGPGAWLFTCECGGSAQQGTSRPLACTRIVVDSEQNFRCETPIVEASDKPCMIPHQLQPLIDDYLKRKKKADAEAFLEMVEAKKQAALKTLGITEAQVNMAKSPPLTSSGESNQEV